MARVAIMVGQEEEPTSFREGADLPEFFEALLAVTDVFAESLGASESEKRELVLSLVLRRIIDEAPPVLAGTLPRYWRLLVELPKERPELMEGVDIGGRFVDMGLVEAGVRVSDTLAAHADDARTRDWPLCDFVNQTYSQLPLPTFVGATFDRATEAMRRLLFPPKDSQRLRPPSAEEQ